jgi:hypothetical protein
MRSDPPTQLREFLAVAKRQGIPFEQAWESAWGRLKMPHATHHRRQYREAMAETRWAFEHAYHGRDVPGGRALLLLAEALVPDVDGYQPVPARPAPPLVITSDKGRREEEFRFVDPIGEAA